MTTLHAAPAARSTDPDAIPGRSALGLDGFAPDELASTVAVVTGGGRGIGRLLARGLAGAGARVGVIARSGPELAETVRLVEAGGGVGVAAVADVTDHAALSRAVGTLRDALGPADLLVNNAGVLGPVGPAWDVDAGEWWRTMEVNLGGILHATQLVVPDMVDRGHGRVLNLTSQAGAYRWPLVSAYSVSKAAVVKFTENLAHETVRYGVSAFSVHPGLLPVGLTETGLPGSTGPDPYADRVRAWVTSEFARGGGSDPRDAMRLLLRIARGDADALTGRHLSVHDDLDALVDHIQTVRRRDLYVMRPERL